MIFWFSSDLFLLRRNGCRRMKRFVFPASNGSAKLDRGFDTSPMVWSLPLVLSMGCQRHAPIVEHIEHIALCLLDLVIHKSMGFYGLLFGHFYGGTFHQKSSIMEEHYLHQKSSNIIIYWLICQKSSKYRLLVMLSGRLAPFSEPNDPWDQLQDLLILLVKFTHL